jgi:hypothetical protein
MVMQLVKYESLRQAKTIKIALQVNRQTKRPDYVAIQLDNEVEFIFRSPAQLDEVIGGLQQARKEIAGDELKIRQH